MIDLNKSTKKILFRATGTKFFFIMFLCISIFITSCNKSSVVGIDVLPANDLLNTAYIDTTTLLTQTVKMDYLRTDETFLSSTNNVLLGTYIDPIFGKTTCSFYTQLMFNEKVNKNVDHPDFGKNPKIDYTILSLVYDPAYYGEDPKAAQKINIYQVSDKTFSIDNVYNSNDTLTRSFVDLANNYTFTPDVTKTNIIMGEGPEPRLILLLNRAIGQSIIEHQLSMTDNATFQKFINGFYITTENTTSLNKGEGNILRFNMADSLTRLTIYYHNDSVKNAQLKFNFKLGSVARFSNFKHDFSGADPDLALQLSATPPIQNDIVYLQSMAGLKVKIEMPYLMNWNKAGVIGINKAEMVIKINPSSAYQPETFAVPEKLTLFGINDDGTDYALPDQNEGTTYFGGFYNTDTKEYRINISRYIQQILNGKRKNNGLHLLVYNGALNANRVVIGGGGNGSPYQMKLSISSTKIP
jgi:Domain of unknown function (DUF4270)